MDPTEARSRFAAERVARLSTVDEQGSPHLVPVTFAVAGSTIVMAVDQKPKRDRELKRLRNVAANPRVSVLADHYDEDWSRLWWVRADGAASVMRDGFAPWVDLLVAKYPQYQGQRPAGPVMCIDVERWSGWSAVA